MTLSTALEKRSELMCELCSGKEDISAYLVPPKTEEIEENQVVTCKSCHDQLVGVNQNDTNHWRCLNESIWSEVSAVKVVAYRKLKELSTQDWASDLLNMMYLSEEEQEWADAGQIDNKVLHKDVNGNILQRGDSVVLIKDLNVKGANFIAKRGTAVRRISLDPDNANHIEGRVNNQHIVILTQYVKKTN